MVHRPHQPASALIALLVLSFAVAGAGPAAAQPKGKREQKNKDKGGSGGDADQGDKSKGKKDEPKRFDFTGLNFEGRLRTPQLLYFLDRASEELERASLQRRSFIPEMVRSIDEENL